MEFYGIGAGTSDFCGGERGSTERFLNEGDEERDQG